MKDQLLLVQPVVKVKIAHEQIAEGRLLSLAAECSIEGKPKERMVVVRRVGEAEYRAFQSMRFPDGQWSDEIRIPQFRHRKVPTTRRGLIAFCRWLYAPYTGGR